MSSHQQRRCLVCGQRYNKWEMIRFTCKEGRMVFDRSQTLFGRGLYVHATLGCFSRLTDVRLWERALGRVRMPLNKENILAIIDDARSFCQLDFRLS
jgi:predicted RNA-binding protein YlxR (DUF448 family)